MDVIRVAATSRSTAVAGAVAGVMREQGYVNVQGNYSVLVVVPLFSTLSRTAVLSWPSMITSTNMGTQTMSIPSSSR